LYLQAAFAPASSICRHGQDPTTNCGGKKRQTPIFKDIQMTENQTSGLGTNPPILSYVKDLPNLCSLAGLACTTLAIYFSMVGNFYAAMIGMVWAVGFDWADGLVARRMNGRTGNDRAFGGQLDVSIDVISYGVAPAVLLLSYGNFAPIFLFGAFVMMAASALRLSYFVTYGLSSSAQYTGLALDNNSLILVSLFLLEGVLSQSAFTAVLYVSCLCLAALNVSQIRTPKLSGSVINVYLLAAYTVVITGIYVAKLL
jgi:phosphatidylserine synthase